MKFIHFKSKLVFLNAIVLEILYVIAYLFPLKVNVSLLELHFVLASPSSNYATLTLTISNIQEKVIAFLKFVTSINIIKMLPKQI